MPANESTLAALLYKLAAALVPGAAGAALSLWSVNRLADETRPRYAARLVFAFASGVAIAHFVGGAVTEYTTLPDIAEDGIRFLTGLYGLGLAENVRKQLPDLVASALGILKAKGGVP